MNAINAERCEVVCRVNFPSKILPKQCAPALDEARVARSLGVCAEPSAAGAVPGALASVDWLERTSSRSACLVQMLRRCRAAEGCPHVDVAAAQMHAG